MEKKLSFREKFNIASGQFGCIVGASVASGVNINLYFSGRDGVYSPIFVLLSKCLLFFTYFLGIEICRRRSMNSYDQLYKKVYAKASVVLSPIADIVVIYTLAACACFCFAGAGSYFNQLFGWPFLAGGIGCAVICLAIVASGGVSSFNKAQGTFSVLMVAILLVIYLYTIFGAGRDALAAKYAEGWVPENFSILNASTGAFLHVSGSLSFISVYLLNTDKFSNRKEIVQTLGIGWTCNVIAFLLPALVLVAFAPTSFQVEIPTLYILTDVVKFPMATTLYSALLLLAYITTGSACVLTISERFGGVIQKAGVKPSLTRVLCPVLICVICVAASSSGLMAIFPTMSLIASRSCAVILALPLLLRAPVLMKKNRLIN